MLFIGVMSGTSGDGIDVALVDFSQTIEVVATDFSPFPDKLKQRLLKLIQNESINMQQLSRLDAELGHLYAKAVNRLLEIEHIDSNLIQAIGLHGQTVYHEPQHQFANTLQIGSATLTAQLTGIKTIANFRQADLAHGGQGAPLAPILHKHLFAQAGQQVLVINLGGIANITSISDGDVFGFDTGPASCLMDEWTQIHCGEAYDQSGQWAKSGKLNQALLDELMSAAYFKQLHPKSTGREMFNMAWLNTVLALHSDSAQNVQRTLLQFTVESIALGIKQTQQVFDQVVVCGGGVHNTFLMEQLAAILNITIESSSLFGLDPDYVEAVLMAWLAWQNTASKTLDLTAITGVKKPLVYGIQYLP